MAWNEPGGNSNNQDPWGGNKRPGGGNGGGRQGPPDLDEVLRKLQDALAGVLGGGKRSPSGEPRQGGGLSILALGAVLLGAVWLWNAVYVVDEQEQAVVLRFGKYQETVGPGLNLYFPPFERKFQENVTRERSYSMTGQMLTEDENIVEVPFTIQYKISDLKNFVLNVDQPEVSLTHATESAIRHVAGSTTMDQVITEGRERMSGEVRERLQKLLDNYGTGITVTQVNIQRATAPAEVKDAFDDVIRAREDEQRERNQAETYANGVVPEARGQAQRVIEEASGYRDEVIAKAEGDAERFSKLVAEYRKAPEVTRERLYLDTLEQVLSNTSKVLISADKGQNNMVYLPLDKLMSKQNAAKPAASSLPSALPSDPGGLTGSPMPSSRDLRVRESR